VTLKFGRRLAFNARAKVDVCQRCEVRFATVEHRHTGVRTCDKCADEIMKIAAKIYANTFDDGDPLNDVRGSLIIESNWDDVECAATHRLLNEASDLSIDN